MNNNSIICPECKNSILSGEKKCPHCGSKKHKGLILCESCSGQFYKDAKSCPHCGSAKHRNALKKHPILSMLLICLALTILLDFGGGDGKNRSVATSSEPSKNQLINSLNFQYETYKGKHKNNPGLAINVEFNNKSDWNIRILGITCTSTNSAGDKYSHTTRLFESIPAKAPHFWHNLSMGDLPMPKNKSESYSCHISDVERY